MIYTKLDTKLSEAVYLSMQNRDTIEFQFPPKILSDSRKGNWQEEDLRGTEPIAVFKTSGPREITLAWTYIVDGGKWSVDKIAAQVRTLRSYFAQIRDGPDTRLLVVYFQMWSLGGRLPMTCRIKSIDVKHGDTIVANNCGGSVTTERQAQGVVAYPLRTDISVELRIWTRGATTGKEVDVLHDLRRSETPDWY